MSGRTADDGAERRHFGGSAGVGYISIMLIFTVICLTIFAVLSFQAAYSNNRIAVRSGEYSQQYYDADASAKMILSELDALAAEHQAGFAFDEDFSAAAARIPGVSVSASPGGVRADYSVEINERLELSVSVDFHRNTGGERYSILCWKSVSSGEVTADDHPSVWDGEEIVS